MPRAIAWGGVALVMLLGYWCATMCAKYERAWNARTDGYGCRNDDGRCRWESAVCFDIRIPIVGRGPFWCPNKRHKIGPVTYGFLGDSAMCLCQEVSK